MSSATVKLILRWILFAVLTISDFGFQELLQFLGLGQFELVAGDEQIVVHTGQSILDQGVIFLGAKQ